jgi:transcriptional regulator with XRE-family HTH domain
VDGGSTADVLDAVGPRLCTLRCERGITLAGLAATTGVPESTLSRLENGQRRATLDLLLPGSADGGTVELLILFDLQGVRTHVRTDPKRHQP